MSNVPNETWTPNSLCPWVTVQNAGAPQFPRFNVKELEYRDANTDPPSDMSCNIYVQVVDETGKPMQGVWVWQKWADGEADKMTDARGFTDFFMSGDSSFDPAKGQVGAYSIYIRHKDYPTATAKGFGLPLKQHVQYLLTFALSISPTPPPVPHQTLLEATKQVVSTYSWMALNDGASLYKFGVAHGLGFPQTDEINYQWNGADYVAQVWNKGIIYCPKTDVNSVTIIPK